MKLLYIGDFHLKFSQPKSRTDVYYDSVCEKINEINKICDLNDIRYIITPGDIIDKPLLSITETLKIVEQVKMFNRPVLTCLGNHDIFGYNLETYTRSSLNIIQMLSPFLTVYPEKNTVIDMGEVIINFNSFSKEQDETPDNYFVKKESKTPVIAVFHGMLTAKKYPFSHTLIDDIKTEADLTICGHDHLGFGLRNINGKQFLNCGSLTRNSASMAEIERPVQVALLNVTDTVFVELVTLKSARPGNEVLDRTQLDEKLERLQLMEEFTSVIKKENSQLGQKLNIFEILEQISQLENINHAIKNEAIRRVQIAMEKLQGGKNE